MLAMFPNVPSFWVWFGLGITAVISYFVGCLNGAVIVSKYIIQDDVRSHGSGNAGLTNFYRTFGGKLTLAVIAIDVVKMLLAVWFSIVIFSVMLFHVPVVVRYWSGLFCMLGHMFPCMFRFKGGKGILSGGTLVFLLDWRVAAAVWLVFLVAAAATRLISLGSCGTGITFPIATGFVYRSTTLTVMAVIMGGLILWQHRSNLKRLLTGNESQFHLNRRESREPRDPSHSEQSSSRRRSDRARETMQEGTRGQSRERTRDRERSRDREWDRSSPEKSQRPVAHRPSIEDSDLTDYRSSTGAGTRSTPKGGRRMQP